MSKGLKELKEQLNQQNQTTDLKGLKKYLSDDIRDGKCDNALRELSTSGKSKNLFDGFRKWDSGTNGILPQ